MIERSFWEKEGNSRLKFISDRLDTFHHGEHKNAHDYFNQLKN